MKNCARKVAVAVIAAAMMLLGIGLATPAAAATGKVTGNVTWTGPTAVGGYVDLMEWNDRYKYWEYAGEFGNVAANGTYTIADVPAGTYTLVVSSDYLATWLGNKTVEPATKEGAVTFTVASGQTVTGKDIALTLYKPQVTVNLTGFTANTSVSVSFNDLTRGQSDGSSVTASATGTATLTRRLSPGQYWVTARTSLSPEVAATQRPFAQHSSFQVSGTSPLSLNLTGSNAQNRLYTPYPDIFGEPAVGSTLTAQADASFSGTPALNPTVRYYWSDGSKVISTTSSTVVPASVLGTAYPAVTVVSQASGQVTRLSSGNIWDHWSSIRPGEAPTPRTVPSIAGKSRVGTTLKVSTGSWTPAPSSYRYQWNRNGKAIAGATQATYRLRPADARTRVSVAVTGVRAGHKTRSIVTASTSKVAKAQTSIVVKPVKKKVKRGARAAVKVRVKAKGVTPAGRIKVKFGKRTVKAKLNKKGRATVRSVKLNSSGRVKIRVNYTGTKAFAKAAKKAQITVR